MAFRGRPAHFAHIPNSAFRMLLLLPIWFLPADASSCCPPPPDVSLPDLIAYTLALRPALASQRYHDSQGHIQHSSESGIAVTKDPSRCAYTCALTVAF